MRHELAAGEKSFVHRMRSRHSVILAGLVAVSAIATGCAPAQLSPQVARKMVDLRQDLVMGKTKIESTTATLGNLVESPRLNTERQVGFYHSEMAGLEQVAQRVRDTYTQMQAKSGDYFNAWYAELGQIQNEQIAAAGAERRKASMKAVEMVRAKLDAAKDVLAPFLSDLRDIDRYFQQDQTAEGVMAIQSVARKTISQKQAALKSLDEVIASIDQVTKSAQ